MEIFSTIEAYELSQICDALQVEKFPQGDEIIKQDEPGDKFYIIEEGEAFATKVFEKGDKPVEVKQYAKGGFFGELALIKNEPRAASVIARSNCKVLSLDRMSFKRLLGPLDNLLKRNADAYVKFVNKK